MPVYVQEYDGTTYKPVTNLTFNLTFTSGNSAGTFDPTVSRTGLGPYDSITIYAALTGNTGGTLDVYIQYSPDGGTTWVDLIHFPQIAAAGSGKYVVTLSRGTQATSITAVGTGTSPALAANTVIPGDFGDRLRVVYTNGAGTSAGASQTILCSATP